jgi:hypothetical protein
LKIEIVEIAILFFVKDGFRQSFRRVFENMIFAELIGLFMGKC